LRHLRELKTRSRRRPRALGLCRVLGVAGLAGTLLAFAVAPASAAGNAGLKRGTSVVVKRAAVAAGLYHALALSSTGAVFAWGWNIVGQLGNGNTNGTDVPVKVKLPGGTRVTGIAAGFAHSLAVTSTGAVLAWGKNYNGDLGNGSTTDSDVPVKVDLPAGTKVTAVAAGGEHNLAVTSTGAVLAWGYNADGQLGNSGTGSSDVPVSVSLPTATKVIAVAAGALDSLAVTSTGAVLAWGYNADGELGDGGTANSDMPTTVKLPAGTKVTATAAGGSLEGVGGDTFGPGHSLALTSTGRVLAWGYNADGELGDGGTANSDVPVKVTLPASTKVTAVAAGELHSLAVTSTGTVLASGGNNFGQLGDGSYKGSDVPVKVDLP
jgi:alpha-tubulin suppressor-like RCC1 family protein